jgi:hypothetical protein
MNLFIVFDVIRTYDLLVKDRPRNGNYVELSRREPQEKACVPRLTRSHII